MQKALSGFACRRSRGDKKKGGREPDDKRLILCLTLQTVSSIVACLGPCLGPKSLSCTVQVRLYSSFKQGALRGQASA